MGEATGAKLTSGCNGNQSLLECCQQDLSHFLSSNPPSSATRSLDKAHRLGLSSLEALLFAYSSEEPIHGCGHVDGRELKRLLQHSSPAVVTISRSVDGFLPFHCAAVLEAKLLQILAHAFNRSLSVEYTAGAVPLAALQTAAYS